MSSTRLTHESDQERSKRRSSRPAAGNSSAQIQQQIPRTAFSEPAGLGLRPPSRPDALQLQRSVGNRAFGQLLANAAQRLQLHEEAPASDDARLEHEADTMGARAAKRTAQPQDRLAYPAAYPTLTAQPAGGMIQLSGWQWDGKEWKSDEAKGPKPDRQGKYPWEYIEDPAEEEPSSEEEEELEGYESISQFGTTVWLKDNGFELDKVAKSHLLQGAEGTHGDGGWHGFGDKMKGNYKDGDAYLHPSKKDPTLYLIKTRGEHTDGNLKVEILRTGRVNGGDHTF